MPDANLVRSVMYLFDCFLDDFYEEKYVQAMSDLDMRAQVEVIREAFAIFGYQNSYLPTVIYFSGVLLFLLHLGDGWDPEGGLSTSVQ